MLLGRASASGSTSDACWVLEARSRVAPDLAACIAISTSMQTVPSIPISLHMGTDEGQKCAALGACSSAELAEGAQAACPHQVGFIRVLQFTG
jgi:hypothetical protein